MKHEQVNMEKKRQMEDEMGCTFCEDGVFAEMSLDLMEYQSCTKVINNIEFTEFKGPESEIKKVVSLVDEQWVQYFDNNASIFCGFYGKQIVSFCIVNMNADTIISMPGMKVGSIGCVGTTPQFRDKGIGLRMVDLATMILKENGCDKAYISYTHIDKWYAKLGYQTFARFSFN